MTESKGLAVLAEYYATMNAHNVGLALSYLHPDVEVTFPEKERNWKGIESANSKFNGMFDRNPTFTASFLPRTREGDGDENGSVAVAAAAATTTTAATKECSEENGEAILVACRFNEGQESASARTMRYHISSKLITEIHHL